MAQHLDDQQFWNKVAGGETTEQTSDGAPCELCSATCRRCGMPLHQHTQAGLIECAWRGRPCQTCNHPPHPDNAPGRCARYTHPGDTARERQLRHISPWKDRHAEGPFYMWRHCNSRRHGKRQEEVTA